MGSPAAEAAIARAILRRMLAGMPPPTPLPPGLDGWAATVSAIAEAWRDGGPNAASKALEAIYQAQPSIARLMATDPPEAAVEILAVLPLAEYDRVRVLEAEALGVRVRTLDLLVAQARGDPSETEAQGQAITFADDDEALWPEPLEGAALLNNVAATYRRYAVLPAGAAEALALWTVHTHAQDVATVSPVLTLQSPRPRCGKTTTLQILSVLWRGPCRAPILRLPPSSGPWSGIAPRSSWTRRIRISAPSTTTCAVS